MAVSLYRERPQLFRIRNRVMLSCLSALKNRCIPTVPFLLRCSISERYVTEDRERCFSRIREPLRLKWYSYETRTYSHIQCFSFTISSAGYGHSSGYVIFKNIFCLKAIKECVEKVKPQYKKYHPTTPSASLLRRLIIKFEEAHSIRQMVSHKTL